MNYHKNQSNCNYTFYIYTTGIAEWGNLEGILKTWNEILCKQICDLIPVHFANINIIHSDILNHIEPDKKDVMVNNILESIQLYNNIDPRIINSSFQTEPLDFESISKQQNPYIIIDMAHIFGYKQDIEALDGITKAFIAGYYGEQRTEPMSLNVVYPGYLGQGEQKVTLINTSFFRIDSTNTITTYINKLQNDARFILNLDMTNEYDPYEKFVELFKKIRTSIYNELRTKFGNLTQYDNVRICLEIELKKELVNLIMNTHDIESILVDKVVGFIISRFFQ
jgi:hypothetical protein